MQLQVTNSPFNEEQAELLNRLLPTLTEGQKVWLGGFLAASPSGVVSAAPAPAAAEAAVPVQAAAAPAVSKDVTILYGSQTGNAQRLAQKAGQTLESNGFNVTVSAMSDFKPNNLKKVQNLLIVASTHGEGDPPDNAITFHEFLHGKRAPKLDDLQFSVLSLGDSSYEFFCQTGKEFDQRLEELGGKRIVPRVDCDLDFDEPAAEWIDSVVKSLSEASAPAAAQTAPAAAGAQVTESEYSRTNPFRAEILESINLNGRGSNKETRHIELSLEGSGLTYKPGDALGVYPENDPKLVDELIAAFGWNRDETVTINKQGDVLSLRNALLTYYEITVLTKPLLEKIAQLTGVDELHDLIGDSEKVKAYIHGRDLLDVVQQFGPFGVSPQDFVNVLRKMPARLYSIASSLEANPDEVHLTIGAVRYNANGRDRSGVCSILCAERLEPGDTLPVYIQHNDNFKLPENPETPVIMIGPGTGVAPFRAFMQEREESGADGKAWMFFGDQHFVTDFLYQTEWQKWLADGVLTKMDVAFSRDTAEKVYVQHRMQENSKELFEWLQQGAAVYVCGDEKNMAHDVHQTLIDIVEKEGSMSREQAEKYVADMQQQKRYQRDVY
ncbi:assimilatory sulfite reductase (NADPH) flavoprotein subunit [Domibacillus sp. DTU_2020_1001157_1_SI_ALB_TIR_016]|uniref:assimilatory sulfite reductase (NADPH) flavoprotein subunit n=1 Tax=Domibacillus sp. DTU_2020_1001157_1_SI_ALB_TIR_016 TaxID=3077789 RepID=UPI0028EEEAD0|nr:assimilatory sulfite reductase (NADPH) flavoprotein subunit [Domibacillus sp. DTU_2020_1001157_1_SI_ALB_TIR_016]WNS82375.1 assimilatory sulfite reductase (NADPH) flavoprotein subunit [Domibacillus sp. DTU_2020_1001157_1_SI_ALB_TIR_016]